MPVSDDVDIKYTQIDENGTLFYTLENSSESSYTIYGEIIEYYDGVQYCNVQDKKTRKDMAIILKGGKESELSINLNERYSITVKGKYRIVVYIHNDNKDINEMVIQDFAYD